MNKLDEFEVIIEYNNLKFSVTGTFDIGKEGEHSSYNDVLGTPPEPPELYVVVSVQTCVSQSEVIDVFSKTKAIGVVYF